MLKPAECLAVRANPNEFDQELATALRNDGKISKEEAQLLTQVATDHVECSVNPKPTFDKYVGKLNAAEGKALDDQARSTMSYWAQFAGNTMLQKRAASMLNGFLLTEPSARLPRFMRAIEADDSKELTVVSGYGMEEGSKIKGGVVTTDNASDSMYLSLPVSLSKLQPNAAGDMTHDELAMKLTRQINAFIEGNKDLMYSGAAVSVVLVK